ncbi:MAG: UDP-N-acetylmuramate--L-alanine ligase [Candidatus Eisenbacteria bacterium]|nr:UDP-N-acetylmuramate--L-alanine ligase [Candidatus Eisenbacteria bacterium]
MFGRVRRIHLIGIGGTGMSGIAEILLNLGFEVSGSDLVSTDVTERLERLGATIVRGHGSALVEQAGVAVVSSAVSRENPEVVLARAAGVPVIPRAELLAELMRVKRGVAVGGAHGKTTTTWMIGLVLARADRDPTVVVGGRLNQLGTNARLGEGDLLVAEADESDGTFLMLAPELAVVTNIDREHLDFYENLEAIKEAFARFCNRVPFFGAAVVNGDDPELRALLPRVTRRVVTFGVDPGADVRAEKIRQHGQESRFTVSVSGRELGEARLFTPGLHNVRNALAAIAVGLELEIPFPVIAEGLEDFRGIHRRMEVKGEHRGRLVMDDYGHHPTEVRATLAALRDAYPNRRLVVVFQPHRFTRTERLAEEFGDAFADAHRLFLLDVYAAGERPIPGVDSGRIADAVERAGGPEPVWIREREEAVERIAGESLAGDLILTLGAGDVWRVGEEIFLALTRRPGGGGGFFG